MLLREDLLSSLITVTYRGRGGWLSQRKKGSHSLPMILPFIFLSSSGYLRRESGRQGKGSEGSGGTDGSSGVRDWGVISFRRSVGSSDVTPASLALLTPLCVTADRSDLLLLTLFCRSCFCVLQHLRTDGQQKQERQEDSREERGMGCVFTGVCLVRGREREGAVLPVRSLVSCCRQTASGGGGGRDHRSCLCKLWRRRQRL